MAEPRGQFTFYRSYFDAISGLKKKDQADFILAVCGYALYEQEPSGLSPSAKTAFLLVKPTLDTGRRKAANGKQGGKSSKQNESKTEANAKQTASEKEKEKEIEIEIENDSYKKSVCAGKAKSDIFASHAAGNESLLSALQGFEQMRKLSKKPMSPRAKELLVGKLQGFTPEEQIAMLDKAIERNWQTVYPPEGGSKPYTPSGGKSTGERQLDEEELAALQRMLAEDSA